MKKFKFISAVMSIIAMTLITTMTAVAYVSTTASHVDNSTEKYFPEIADQGDYASSVGYATTYYQMTYEVAKSLNADASEYTFSPEWTYSLINGGSDDGGYAADAYKILDNFGAPFISEFTGSATSMETEESVWKSAMKYKLNADGMGGHYSENTFDDTDDFILSMKEELASGNILVTGSNSAWWFGDDDNETVTVIKDGEETTDKGIVYVSDTGKSEGRQLVTVVGYDDEIEFKYGAYSTKGAFKIANSKGSDWGNDGYIWVSYEAFYQDSENRPAKKNGYGFTSSWWWQEADQNVYYMILVSDLPYTPTYVGVLTFENQDISNMILNYRGRLDASSAISSENLLYDNTDYIKGFSTEPFTGKIAVDLNSISSYFTNTGACWEIISNGISDAQFKIYKNTSTVYSGNGTSWHTHVYDRQDDFQYIGSKWYRYDKCPLCGGTKTISGTCYLHMDFENGIGTWGNNGKGVLSTEKEADENSYLKIDYSNSDNTAPTYFEVYNPSSGAYSSTQMTGNIEMCFDVKFEGKDADVILKRRQPGIDNMVLRVCSKETGRLMYGSGDVRKYFSNNNGWVNSVDTWFTVEISANITSDSTKAYQNITVKNRDTGEVISTISNMPLNNTDSFCNLFVIGGSCTVDIDNIAIRKIS